MITAGDSLPPLSLRVRRADLVRYAGASLDFNPIHWNDRVAGEVGLPGVIAHGMYTMAIAGRLVTDWPGGTSPRSSPGRPCWARPSRSSACSSSLQVHSGAPRVPRYRRGPTIPGAEPQAVDNQAGCGQLPGDPPISTLPMPTDGSTASG
jgi:hypothetical protein